MRTTFLFRRSFFLFYYLVRTTFLFRRSFFLFYYLVRTTFFILYVVFSFLLSRAHDFFFYFVCRFFFSIISCARLFSHVVFFLFYCLIDLFSDEKLHSHQTANQPPTNAVQFLWLGLVWSGKKLPALIEERIYPRSTPAVSALYPWCIHAQISLFPNYSRPFGWPIPALHEQPPKYSWYNYAHFVQYRTNPRSVCLISTTGLKSIIKANVMWTDSLMRVLYPICA